jgi:N-carbamoyl-L-amino-acid hydrolase
VTAFRTLWDGLAPIGRDPATGGYLRYAYSEPELACRGWFERECAARGLPVEVDGNGNLWATWVGADPAAPAVATGSHFDSVPHGGGYDGPLGIVSALLAVDSLRASGFRPHRSIRLVAFAEEEGSRFGVACLGSRLLTGAIDPARALALTDRDGRTLAAAMTGAGLDPAAAGPDPDRLAHLAAFVELHVEQGRALTAPVGVASAIWPHGRWRLEFDGEGDHAGTTVMADRHDPMLTFAFSVLAVNKQARLSGGHATVGRVEVTPNATNAIPSRVVAWLDARAADQATLDGLTATIGAQARERAGRDGTSFAIALESVSPVTEFDIRLRDRIAGILDGAPILPTGAGHDAGVLAAAVPTAMLFVRNPTGVSHAPAEGATDEDCVEGVHALAAVLRELAT